MLQDISYKNISRIALPILFSGFAQHLVQFIDAAFLGQLGEVELGAAGNSGIYYFIFFLVGMGISTGAQILIGRRNGEGKHDKIGVIFYHAMILLFVMACISFCLLRFLTPFIFEQIYRSENIVAKSLEFLDVRAWSIFPGMLNSGIISFLTGITRTGLFIWSTLIMAVVNLVLDYGLIFGNLGMPEMGVQGAALASVCSDIAATIFFVTYLGLRVDVKRYGFFKDLKINLEIAGSIFKIGFPVMIQFLVSIMGWFTFFTIIEKMGERELAISQIVKNIYMLLIVPAFSYNQTTSTLVSNLLGQGQPQLVFPLIKRVIVTITLINVFLVQAIVWFPRELIAMFTSNPDLFHQATISLYIVGTVMFLFAVGFTMLGAVTGTGSTKTCLKIEVISIAGYLGYVVLVAMFLKWPLEYVWFGELVYFLLLTSQSWLFLRSGTWRKVEL